MPEDSKKTHSSKGKHEAKDQRKPRQRHVPSEKSEKKIDKKAEESVRIPKVPNKPVYEDPGPEFYKNLKRETDEILKITEAANTKYKKKEIQNNWSKYEMPIESYEEIEEQENLGADYEKLIQAPLSVGGHFQFKHEKSWDTDTGPSLYDKYFEINMENLATAISTIPFFERNNIEQSIFSETDILNMNNRAIKYKRKYYNDKSYTTPEIESQESILNSIRQGLTMSIDTDNENIETTSAIENDIVLESENPENTNNDVKATIPPTQKLQEFKLEQSQVIKPHFKEKKDVDDFDQLILANAGTVNVNTETNIKVVEEAKKIEAAPPQETQKECYLFLSNIGYIIYPHSYGNEIQGEKLVFNIQVNVPALFIYGVDLNLTSSQAFAGFYDVLSIEDVNVYKNKIKNLTNAEPPTETKAVIESPEDLEKWLDDFLEG